MADLPQPNELPRDAVASAQLQAQATGRPVQIGQSGLWVYPQAGAHWWSPVSTSFGPAPATPTPGVQAPFTGSPFNAAGMQGLPGTQAGPAVAAPYQPDIALNAGTPIPATLPTLPALITPASAAPSLAATTTAVAPPASNVANAARRYRTQHGMASPADLAANQADALNALSLAAAQAGRTQLLPQAPTGPPNALFYNRLVAPPAASTNFLTSNLNSPIFLQAHQQQHDAALQQMQANSQGVGS